VEDAAANAPLRRRFETKAECSAAKTRLHQHFYITFLKDTSPQS
jgi:hypothetical protein